jgi:hypothetical protein
LVVDERKQFGRCDSVACNSGIEQMCDVRHVAQCTALVGTRSQKSHFRVSLSDRAVSTLVAGIALV